MTAFDQRPLLFLDVDGPLIPFGTKPGGHPTYPPTTAPQPLAPNPLLARINPDHGPQLAALPVTLIWATTWMADANECVAPRLGLPPLDLVTWPEPSATEDQDIRNGLHWKTRPLVDWAAGRPFIWVDDEITPADRTWVSTHHPGPALLHRVAPREGLTDADYTALHDWLSGT